MKNIPSLDEINVIPPGTTNVLTWPVIEVVDFRVDRREDHLRVSYPYFDEDRWPTYPADSLVEGVGATFGMGWLVYYSHDDGRWVAEGLDWWRSPERRRDGIMPLAHMTRGGPSGDDPVAIFAAGPSRYTPDKAEYRYRTALKWFRWSDMEPIEVETPEPPDPEVKGHNWPLFEDGRAPIVVMSPTAQMSRAVWRAWLKQYVPIVVEPGWDGTHTPLQARWRAEIKTLAKRNAARGLVSTFWLEGDNDGDDAGSTFPSWDKLIAGTQRVFDELSDVPGWKILGIGYDVQERGVQGEVNRWLGWCGENRPEGWLFCARALPDRNYGGDVAAWEDHLPTLDMMDAVLLGEIRRSGKRPVWNTERNRAQDGGRGKHTTEENMPTMIRIARARNVGLIMGIQGPAGRVSDFGSTHAAWPAEFRAALLRGDPEPGPEPGPKPGEWVALNDAELAELFQRGAAKLLS